MNIWISVMISIIGLGYFIYGKKLPDFSFLIFGLILMIYPYFIHNLWGLIMIGIILLAAPFFCRRFFS